MCHFPYSVCMWSFLILSWVTMLIARIIGTVSPWINHSGTKNTFNMLLLAQTEVFVDGLLTHSDAMLLLFVPCVFFMKKLSVFMQT